MEFAIYIKNNIEMLGIDSQISIETQQPEIKHNQSKATGQSLINHPFIT